MGTPRRWSSKLQRTWRWCGKGWFVKRLQDLDDPDLKVLILMGTPVKSNQWVGDMRSWTGLSRRPARRTRRIGQSKKRKEGQKAADQNDSKTLYCIIKELTGTRRNFNKNEKLLITQEKQTTLISQRNRHCHPPGMHPVPITFSACPLTTPCSK